MGRMLLARTVIAVFMILLLARRVTAVFMALLLARTVTAVSSRVKLWSQACDVWHGGCS